MIEKLKEKAPTIDWHSIENLDGFVGYSIVNGIRHAVTISGREIRIASGCEKCGHGDKFDELIANRIMRAVPV